jgi:DNA polymerase III subunit beta
MKAVISKIELISLISKIQSIVAAKPAIPVLSNILIEAIDDQLILSATDLTTSMKSFSESKIIEEGTLVVPARKFFHLIKELTSAQVKITSHSDEIAEIVSGSSKFKINGLNKTEFPTMPDSSSTTNVAISSSKLKEMLQKTSFAAAREDNRYMLNGILFQINNKIATFIATDGKRLAKSHTTLDIDPSFQGSYIIPIKAVEEMIKMLDGEEKNAQMHLMHDKVFLENNNLTLSTKLLSGQFPDVEKVIPKNNTNNIKIHREELIALLRQVALFTSDTSHSVHFLFDKGMLHLKAMSSEIGEGHVSMEIEYDNDAVEIAFNPHYFIDILRHSNDETISFAFSDAYNPGIVTDSSSSLFVIMPMRLNESAFTPQNSVDVNDSKDPVLT